MNEEFIGGGKINFDNSKIQHMRTVNSTLFFVLSFVIVDFINNVAIFFVASANGLTSILKYHSVTIVNGLEFLKRDTKSLIFISGVFICTLIGIFSLYTYHKLKKKYSFNKIFFLWLSFNSFMAVLTRVAFVELYPSGWFSKLMLLWNANANTLQVLRVGSLIVAAVLAVYFSRLFLQTTNTKKYLKNRVNRRKYFSQVVFIPWGVGSVASYFFFFPNTDLIDGLHFIMLLIPVFIMYLTLRSRSLSKTYIHRYPSSYQVNKTALIVLILVFIEFHVFLVNGVHF